MKVLLDRRVLEGGFLRISFAKVVLGDSVKKMAMPSWTPFNILGGIPPLRYSGVHPGWLRLIGIIGGVDCN